MIDVPLMCPRAPYGVVSLRAGSQMLKYLSSLSDGQALRTVVQEVRAASSRQDMEPWGSQLKMCQKILPLTRKSRETVADRPSWDRPLIVRYRMQNAVKWVQS